MFNILCFGDSNTFGTNPKGGRHSWNVRWPGRLQQLLGKEYYIIEEGMGGRTTVWDDPLEPNRCGLSALPVALQSHKPLDMVILSLGTNDCKAHFHATPRIIAKGMECLCKEVRSFDYGPSYPVPKILIISPIHILEDVEHSPFASFDKTSPEKSRLLAPLYRNVASEQDCLFLDGSTVAKASPIDQLHMDKDNHRALAEAVADIVKTYFEA